jgi:proline iminopeptidase
MADLSERASHLGLNEHVINLLSKLFIQFHEIEAVTIFGSRGRGDFQLHSDLDLAVFAPTMMDETFVHLWNMARDLPIPFQVDVVLFHWIDIPAFRHNILADGVELWVSGKIGADADNLHGGLLLLTGCVETPV